MKLKLQATTAAEQKIKAYLEENASETLAEKINNGVHVQKDDKTLTSKKTLAGFMKFACDEAKKQAEKGAQYACIDDQTVYGWAIHYFEEDSIEGALFNKDGTEYKMQPNIAAKAPAVKYSPPKPQPKPQLSMFDLLDAKSEETEEPVEQPDGEPQEEAEQTIKEPLKPQASASPVYRKYLDVQEKYPQAVIAMRLGDFYEVFGDNAKLLAEELPLTLTGRDCGLEERIPMVGFPYHASDMYFEKILQNGHTVVILEDGNVRELPAEQNVDPETGEILSEEEMQAFDGDIDETIPTVSGIIGNQPPECRTNPALEKEIAAVMDDAQTQNGAPMPEDEDDFDISAFDTEAVAILSEIFGDEIELR